MKRKFRLTALKRAFVIDVILTLGVYFGCLALHFPSWAMGLMMFAYGIPTGYFVYALKILKDYRHLGEDEELK